MTSFQQKLEHYLADQTGQTVTIHKLTPLAGGASRDSWAIDLMIGDQPEKLVMRRDLPTTMNTQALTRAQEYTLMRIAYQHGVKVARMRWLCEDPAVLEFPFFLMDYVDGISIGRKVITLPELTQARAALPDHMAKQLALIHTINPDQPAFRFLQRPRHHDPAREAIDSTYEMLDAIGAQIPALEYALRWCDRHAPKPDRITFLHGDFRVGNLLVDQHGLAAVIDWEFAHIGDPAEEIGYLCMRDWRFGNDRLHAGGLTDREQFIAAYERYSGYTIDRSRTDWWEIIGNIRWAVICLTQAERHLSGRDPSVELASLGRRSAEMQLEALRLIEKAGVNHV